MDNNENKPQENECVYHSKSVLELLNHKPIEIHQLHFVLDFTLLWSLFEAKVAGKNTLSLGKLIGFMNDKVKIKTLQEQIIFENAFEKIICFERGEDREGVICFNGVGTHRIELRMKHDLNGRHKACAHEIIDLFERNSGNNILTIIEKIKLLSYIAYRLRNNLFHGQKDLYYLWEQKALFDAINPVLKELIIVADHPAQV